MKKLYAKSFLYALRNGWIDPDYGCHATFWWTIWHKAFGRAFRLKIVGQFLEKSGYHFITGFLFYHPTLPPEPENASCQFCRAKGFKKDVNAIGLSVILGLGGKIVPHGMELGEKSQ